MIELPETRKATEQKLMDLVGNSMCWVDVKDKTQKSYEELKKDFVERIFNKFPLHVIHRVIRTTQFIGFLTEDKGEVHLDTGELYSFLINSDNISIEEYQHTNQLTNIKSCKYLLILFKTPEPKILAEKALEFMNKYKNKCKDSLMAIKQSNTESQIVIYFN